MYFCCQLSFLGQLAHFLPDRQSRQQHIFTENGGGSILIVSAVNKGIFPLCQYRVLHKWYVGRSVDLTGEQLEETAVLLNEIWQIVTIFFRKLWVILIVVDSA